MISIYNKISDYIIVLNYSGEILFCNQKLLNRLNYSHKEILNTDIYKLIKNKDRDVLIKANDTNQILEFYTKENDIVKINSNITIDKFNNEDSIFIIGKEESAKSYTIEMLEDLLDNIDVCTFILDSKGKYLYLNKVFANMLNKNVEDIIGTSNKDHWQYENYDEFERNNKETFELRRPKIFNERVKTVDGYHWYESYKSPIYYEDGQPKYIAALSKNINLTRVISEELYKNYNIVNLQSNTKNTTDNIDLKEKLTNIGQNILEYTKADGMSIFLYDKEIEGLVPAIKLKDANIHIKNIEIIPLKKEDIDLDKYKQYTNRIINIEEIDNLSTVNYSDLDEVQYVANYVIELYNEFIGVIGMSFKKGNYPKFNSDEYMTHMCNQIAMVIKNIRLSNEVINENKKRMYTEKELERYINISVDLVGTLGSDLYFKKVSPNWSNVLGWSEEELLSTPIMDILHPEDIEKYNRRRKNKGNKPDPSLTRAIIRLRHKDGRYINIELSSEYIKEEGIYMVAARDFTKYLEIENEKKKLQEEVKLETVRNEFFSNISHEFRTPINIILGTMQVINRNIQEDNVKISNLSKHTKYIRQNSYRLLKLVNNLIDISKMDIGMYELRSSNQNIISLIEDIALSVAEYTKDNNINLIFDTDSEEIITYCDPDKIERIMLNILSNAIKYTKENGLIKVQITTKEKEVEISIKDNGVGIPKDKLNVIFDRFGQVDDAYSRKCEGSGIGLSLVKNLVQMHSGEINVISEVGKGSEFVFTIPIFIKEEDDIGYVDDRKSKHVERCDIEFSDIYTI